MINSRCIVQCSSFIYHCIYQKFFTFCSPQRNSDAQNIPSFRKIWKRTIGWIKIHFSIYIIYAFSRIQKNRWVSGVLSWNTIYIILLNLLFINFSTNMNTHIFDDVSLKLLKWIEFLKKSHYVDKNAELKAFISEQNVDFTHVMAYINEGAKRAKTIQRYFRTTVKPEGAKLAAKREWVNNVAQNWCWMSIRVTTISPINLKLLNFNFYLKKKFIEFHSVHIELCLFMERATKSLDGKRPVGRAGPWSYVRWLTCFRQVRSSVRVRSALRSCRIIHYIILMSIHFLQIISRKEVDEVIIQMFIVQDVIAKPLDEPAYYKYLQEEANKLDTELVDIVTGHFRWENVELFVRKSLCLINFLYSVPVNNSGQKSSIFCSNRFYPTLLCSQKIELTE